MKLDLILAGIAFILAVAGVVKQTRRHNSDAAFWAFIACIWIVNWTLAVLP